MLLKATRALAQTLFARCRIKNDRFDTNKEFALERVFSVLRVRIGLCALSHEKDLLHRPLRQGMSLPEDPSSRLDATGHDARHSLRESFDASFTS
jgi:hypothetical protein